MAAIRPTAQQCAGDGLYFFPAKAASGEARWQDAAGTQRNRDNPCRFCIDRRLRKVRGNPRFLAGARQHET